MKTKELTVEYRQWFKQLKEHIRSSQIKAAVKVNKEMLELYWNLGQDISERKAEAVWGNGFFDMLSKNLKEEFPSMQGFSPTNLKYMKRFYEFYNQSDIIRHQIGDELKESIFSIPWRHHVEIITKFQQSSARTFN